MAADITAILSAMRSVLESAYTAPAVAVLVKARSAAEPGTAPMPGWMPGDPCPAFCLSELEAETPDECSTFETVSLGYPVLLEDVFTGAPQPWDDDPGVRQRRIELMNLFFKENLPDFPASEFDVEYRPGRVYQPNAAQDVVISSQVFVFTISLDRPGLSA